MNLSFVSLSNDYYDGTWLSRQQIMSRLSFEHKVLFVSPPFSIRQVLKIRSLSQQRTTGLQKANKNLYTYVPPRYLPVNYRYPTLNRLTHLGRIKQIKSILNKFRFSNIILYIWHPYYANFISNFGEHLICYHPYDMFTSYPDLSNEEKENIIQQEEHILKKADLVFCLSQPIFERTNIFGNAHIIPSGVDFSTFSLALRDDLSLPHFLQKVPQPRIGYVGRINYKVDFNLLAHIAKKRPNWSIVLVGPVNLTNRETIQEFQDLLSMRNVYHFGYQPREELPAYIKGLDVCLMCYRLDCWAYFGNPIKLYEYFSAGKPIVSSDLIDIRDLPPLLQIVSTVEEWIEAIEFFLAFDSEEMKIKRVEFARHNTWDQRVEKITNLIKDKIKSKY